MANLIPRTSRPATIASSVAVLVSLTAPFGLLGAFSEPAMNTVWAGTIVALLIGIKRLPRHARLSWMLVAAALALTLVGAGLRAEYDTMGDLSASRSLIPDLASGPGYLLLGTGLAMVVRTRRRGVGGGLDAVLDGSLAGLAALALAWVFLIEPALLSTPATIGTRLSIVAYPPLSIVFVVFTAQLAFASGIRASASHLTGVLAMSMMLVGDVLFTLADARVVHISHGLVMLPYALTFSAVIYFSLHPTFVEFAEPMSPQRVVASPARLAIVAIALTTPAMVTVTQHRMALADRIVLASIILALTGIATWRVIRALQHHARSEKTLLYQATHDVLTGALNRAGLVDELARLDGRGIPHAVLFLDMDRFKLVNDSFGHSFGDELLVAVAERLRCGRRLGDVVARIGGDEFVVVTDSSAGIDAVVRSAEEIRQAFLVPFLINDTEIPVSFSVGVATSTPGSVPGELLRDADTAMYRAKDGGRDAVLVFDDSMRDRASNRLELERDLRHALDRDELAVHYQPVVDLETGTTLGFEALMRWNHPTRGTVPPLEFIPIAEETGIIIEIGAWILDEACRELAHWRATVVDGSNLWISVNVSARQLRDPDFTFMVERALERHHLEPDGLVLEVTESMLLDEGPAMPAVLGRIRDIGLRLSIDDFGTGYSSLAYVQRYPFNCVKVDRAFVELLDAEEGSEHQLVGAIVAMAAALDLTTIAEGVETVAQGQRLIELGCTMAQGYYFSRPVPADQIPATLRRLGLASHRDSVLAG